MNIARFLQCAIASAGAMLIVSGCTTIIGPQPNDDVHERPFTTLSQSNSTYNSNPIAAAAQQQSSAPTQQQSATTPQQPSSPPALPPSPQPPPQAFLSAELQEAIAKLNIRIDVSSTGNLHAAECEQALRGRLANTGFAIIPSEDPDLLLRIMLESELFDKSGNFYLFKGRAVTELWRGIDQKQLAGSSVTANGQRQLGERDAQIDLMGKLVAQVDQWTTVNVLPDRVGIAAAELTLALSRVKILKGGDQDEINRFMQKVQGIPGVLSCRLTHNDAGIRVYRFRVIYYPEKVPMGLSNAAADACGYRTR